jgi:RHS repeat-associated protein
MENGLVIKILGIENGLALLDLDNSNQPATSEVLAEWGITDEERQQLAASYGVGKTLWRARFVHFCPIDWNVVGVCPKEGGCPSPPDNSCKPDNNPSPPPCPNGQGGCILEIENQTVGETLPINGTSFDLNYRSNRVPGRVVENTLMLAIPNNNQDNNYLTTVVRLNIAGRQIEQSIDKNSAQSTYQFVWDGKDAYGRTLQGKHPITIQQCYEYNLAYRMASFTPNRGNFGRGPGGGMIPIWDNNGSYSDWATSYSRDGSRLRNCTNTHQVTIGTIWDARGEGLGGWTVSPHHVYAPQTQSLILGTGQNKETSLSLGGVIQPVIKQDFSNQVAVASDGVVYFNGDGGNIYRLKDDGTKELFLGGTTLDNAVQGVYVDVNDIAFSPIDNNLYLAISYGNNNGYIVKVTPDKKISIIAGGGTQPYQPGLKATSVALSKLLALTIDKNGIIYASNLNCDYYCHSYYIYQINRDGTITTKLDNPRYYYSSTRIGNLAVAGNGDIYFSSALDNGYSIQCFVTRLTPSGQQIPYGNGSCFWVGMAIGKDESLYLLRGTWRVENQLWRVLKDGTYLLVAGGGTLANDAGNNASATAISLNGSSDLAISPDGILYVVEANANRIRKIAPALPSTTVGDIDIPSSDGSQIYHFNNQGKHLKTLDSLTGETLFQFNYDSNGYLIEIIEKNGDSTKIARDANSVPKEIIAPTGQKTFLTLNQNGFLSQLSNDKQTWQINYSKDGLMTEFINPRGSKNSFVFDSLGLITRDDNAAGGGWLFERQINGAYDFTVSLKSKLGIETRYQTKWQDGDLFRTIFNSDGTQKQSTEAKNGISTSISADGTTFISEQLPDPRFGMFAPLSNSTVKTPNGLQATTTHQRQVTLRTDNGLLPQTLIDTISNNGKQSRLAFDVSSQSILKQTPMGRQTILLLDNELKKVVQKQITGIEPVFYQYDSKGKVTQITQADRVVSLTYNDKNELAQLTDALNRTISFSYDSLGQLTQQTLADGRIINYVYDSNGNLTSITPPSRPLHAFDYDAIDQQIQYVPPTLPTIAQPQTQYEYNLDKKLTQITRPDGQSISFNYDELKGRLNSITTPNGNQTLLYDDKGRLNQITSFDNQELKYTYDGSLPLSETWNGVINGALQLTYNNDFKVVSSSLNGNVLNYQYDNDGLLTQVGDLTLTHDAQNGLLKETKLGDLTTQRTHSNFAELQEEVAKYSNNELYHVYYTRDKGGRITQKQEIINGISKVYDYRYDMAGRLIEVKLDNSIIETYQYDANGNRLNNNAIYDDQDRLLQDNSNTYTYSQNGDLKTKNNASFNYDVFGNLRSVVLPEKTIDYVIDARNRRIGKKINGQLVQGFLYAGKLKPIAELDANGNIVARFIYGSKINIPDYILKGNKTYRVVSDHLGSPRLIVDISDGSIAQQIDYDTFGNILFDSNPNFQPFAFAGGLNDNDTGLIRFGARDYDPQIGRWTIKDPIGLAAGTNVFIYVNNDPVNFVDITGKNPIAIGIGAGIAIGRAATIIAPRLIALAKLANSALSNWLHNENVAPPEENPPAEGDKEGESEQPTDKPKEHSEGEKALNDLLNDLTNSGSKPLSPEDADAALDLGKELGLGTRDDRKEDHWKGGPHIHIDKCRVPKGGKHIPALPND